LTDISHVFGQDLTFGPTGDLAVASVPTVTTQRVLRRLLTNQGDYLWQLKYGAGLPSLVGEPVNVGRIKGRIRQQMQIESGVARNPAPTVKVSSAPDGTVFANVTYADVITGETQSVSAPLTPVQSQGPIQTPQVEGVPFALGTGAGTMSLTGYMPTLQVGTNSPYVLSTSITPFAVSSLT
jgi:phage baseplate assembly protein W